MDYRKVQLSDSVLPSHPHMQIVSRSTRPMVLDGKGRLEIEGGGHGGNTVCLDTEGMQQCIASISAGQCVIFKSLTVRSPTRLAGFSQSMRGTKRPLVRVVPQSHQSPSDSQLRRTLPSSF
jgi:hypothetical protein